MWLRKIEEKNRCLSFPPPWEFQTPSPREPQTPLSLGPPDPSLLGTPRLLINLPRGRWTDWSWAKWAALVKRGKRPQKLFWTPGWRRRDHRALDKAAREGDRTGRGTTFAGFEFLWADGKTLGTSWKGFLTNTGWDFRPSWNSAPPLSGLAILFPKLYHLGAQQYMFILNNTFSLKVVFFLIFVYPSYLW